MAKSRFLISALVAIVLGGAGCNRDLGECNLDGVTEEGVPLAGPAAFDLAFRETDGLPMYEGQALVQTSCGAGQFCHSPAAERDARFGVPAGLNFDLDLACTDPSVDSTCANLQPCDGENADSPYCERLSRLDGNQSKLGTWAGQSIQEIRGNTMPPGEAGRTVRDTRQWLKADGTPLPEIGTPEAEDIIRNWLACASPVVARTETPPSAQLELTPCQSIDGEACVYSGPGASLPEPTWSSIYASLIFGTCLTCHGPVNTNTDQNPDNPNGFIPGGASPQGLAALDLSGTDLTDTSNWASDSHAAVFDVPASSAGLCEGQGTVVIPNDAGGSLMIQKMLATQTCGAEMPIAGGVQTISNSVINVVEQWINLGAPND
ncbi:MAG: hypothetical protein WBG86_04165 [Polyangiales bacterium]